MLNESNCSTLPEKENLVGRELPFQNEMLALIKGRISNMTIYNHSQTHCL